MIWTTLIFFLIAGFVALIYLLLEHHEKLDKKKSSEKVEYYANIISESNGSINKFLWISYTSIIIWSLTYLFIHLDEFIQLFT